MKRLLAIAILLLAMAATAGAEIAPLINYQGRLTNDEGGPVADGSYQITFNIYASIGAPSPIWTSGQQSVSVAGGIFDYILGSTAALPHNIFDNQLRYLGITVGSDPEVSPRTRFTAVPYSYKALKADTALSLAGEEDFVHTAGDTMKDDLVFDGDDDGNYEASISVSTVSANIYLKSSDTTTAILYGAAYGELALYYGYSGGRRAVLAGLNNGGRLRLYDGDAVQQIELDAGTTGNSSVELPDNAIEADEILNEPGIAGDIGSSSPTLTTTMQDCATVTITPPGPGYIYVAAHCAFNFYGTTGLSGAYAQIDTTAGGGNKSESVFSFQDAYANTGTHNRLVFVDKVFYVDDASTRTYRLEALKYSISTGDVSVSRSRIRAMYFPTAYGSLSTAMSDPGDFPDAEPVTTKDEFGNIKTEYKVDLRDLELKAKEAQIRAFEAEQALDEAREELERENREQ